MISNSWDNSASCGAWALRGVSPSTCIWKYPPFCPGKTQIWTALKSANPHADMLLFHYDYKCTKSPKFQIVAIQWHLWLWMRHEAVMTSLSMNYELKESQFVLDSAWFRGVMAVMKSFNALQIAPNAEESVTSPLQRVIIIQLYTPTSTRYYQVCFSVWEFKIKGFDK